LGKTAMTSVVVVIPTMDEALHIRRAIRSALALGRVVVVDSGSTDDTRRLASEMGAEVVEHAWEGYAGQKNWALAQIEGRFDWVLFLDADEWIPDDLAAEIRRAIESREAGFHLPRRNVFEGRVLRHAWWYPDYQLRLFRLGQGRFEDRLVHEHVIVGGPVGFLDSPLMHENLKGLDAFIHRHVRYADLEAREMLKARAGGAQGQRSGRLLGSWPERRRFIKTRIWYRMPFRPAVRFLWMFVIRRGFLDGKPGLVYCQLIAAYEAMIDARLLELERAGAQQIARPIRHHAARRPALNCPVCRIVLLEHSDTYVCARCGRTYPIVDGIAVLLPDNTLAEHDDLAHLHVGLDQVAGGDVHKAAQAEHFDRAMAEEFEITRPHGTSRLYRFMLAEKFRRAVGPIRLNLVGASALSVCGGSGMDAEFLAREGAAVTNSDLSLGAAARANARSERYGMAMRSIVADVEHLPFADESVDLVAVHDGLHHLDDPYTGLSEMTRVARRWVIVTEPARASATRLAIRLGLALESEEAGNHVARMDLSEVAAFLGTRGYVVLRAERYAMYYPHFPGAVFSLLSRPIVFPIVRLGWRIANEMLGRFGNKMVVVAERRTQAD
jgi:glycosyltransferase involved in cell wall biosynthesis/SAM-dependent methyltransferase/uncharacterized protein YbaR (Trm112 family)